MPRSKIRVVQYMRAVFTGADIVDTAKQPELVFVRTKRPYHVLRSLIGDETLFRVVARFFYVRGWVRKIDELACVPGLLSDELTLVEDDRSGDGSVNNGGGGHGDRRGDSASSSSEERDSKRRRRTRQCQVSYPGRMVLRIQTFPKNMAPQVVAALRLLLEQNSIELCSDPFTHVLMVVHAYDRYHYGLLPAHLFLKDVEMPLDPVTMVSRAYLKLKELFEGCAHRERLGLQRFVSDSIRERRACRVIDVGSSPGGWTAYLAQRLEHAASSLDSSSPLSLLVTSVDPGVLAIQKRFLESGIVQHFRTRLERVPAEELRKSGPFDMVVCDMNIVASASIPIILEHVMPHCRDGTRFVITLKLARRGDRDEEGAVIMLQQTGHFEDISVRWLLANSIRERTLVARYVEQSIVGADQTRPLADTKVTKVIAAEEEGKEEGETEETALKHP